MKLIAGVDEVGRGPIAGPVTAAAVVLNNNTLKGLADSKVLSPNKRDHLNNLIKGSSIAWSIAFISSKKIDTINILQASLLAMKNAIEGLKVKPDEIYIDGLYKPDLCIKSRTIVQGDSKEKAIMAASIIAKVARDKFMIELDKKYPDYGFKNNKGYPTEFHLKALKMYGPCKEHRASFRPLKK